MGPLCNNMGKSERLLKRVHENHSGLLCGKASFCKDLP